MQPTYSSTPFLLTLSARPKRVPHIHENIFKYFQVYTSQTIKKKGKGKSLHYNSNAYKLNKALEWACQVELLLAYRKMWGVEGRYTTDQCILMMDLKAVSHYAHVASIWGLHPSFTVGWWHIVCLRALRYSDGYGLLLHL